MLPPGCAFCVDCGHPVAPWSPGSLGPPEEYTPQHLRDRILTSRPSMEGERKQVTVLFADLKSSLELIVERDPEEARDILDPVLDLLMQAVHRFEGTVNQVLGDGIMALFGAPLAHEDHAVRACYAALRMQEGMRAVALDARRGRGVNVQVRVGINSGEVVVRSIANNLRMDYSAVGQTTHLAARMEQIADPGRIVIAPDTARLVEGLFDLRSLGTTRVKGLAEPIEVHELVGARPARSSHRRGTARGLTPFMGRRRELDLLAAALERVENRHGQVLAIVGEPGIGKSRLIWEFTRSGVPRHWLVLAGGAVSYGRVTPFLPIVELLRDFFQIGAADSSEHAARKVAARVLDLDPLLERALPWLLALLDLPAPHDARVNPAERRQRTFDAVKRFFVRLSADNPVLLILEDLHWADSETQALLDALVEGLPATRIVVVVSYRPPHDHHWTNKTYYHRLQLEPLAGPSVQAMLEELVGGAAELEALKALLIHRTDGNPFFLEESIRTLVEGGALSGERGAYRLVRAVHALDVPATVHAVLAARIDRLPEDEKHLLQCAAVIGRTIAYPVLASVAGVPEETVRRGLASLQTAELLHEIQLFPELAYSFAHALTQEVAYASLLHDQRRTLHLRILEELEALPAEHFADQIERLAHHATHGEAWDKAFRYLRQAAQRAFSRAAYEAAVALFERALHVLDALPGRPEQAVYGFEVRLELRAALVPLARFKEILACLTEAERLAVELDDQRRLDLVHAFLTNYFQITGEPERGLGYGRRALVSAQLRADQPVAVLAAAYLSATSFVIGDFPRAIEFGNQAVRSVTEQTAQERFGMTSLPAVYARLALVRALSEVGEFSAGLARAREGLAMATAAADRVSMSMAHLGLGYAYLRRDPGKEAIEPLEHALDVARAANPIWLPQIASTLASAYVAAGRALDALRLLEEAAGHAAAMERAGRQLGEGIRLEAQAAACLALGRTDSALSAALEALDVFAAIRAQGYQAWALRLIGAIHAASGGAGSPEAEAIYLQARALGAELGMRPLQARCDFELGRLYRQGRRLEAARAALGRAEATFAALDMSGFGQLARADLTTLD